MSEILADKEQWSKSYPTRKVRILQPPMWHEIYFGLPKKISAVKSLKSAFEIIHVKNKLIGNIADLAPGP